jgi:hypothetical protein
MYITLPIEKRFKSRCQPLTGRRPRQFKKDDSFWLLNRLHDNAEMTMQRNNFTSRLHVSPRVGYGPTLCPT